MPLAVRLTIDGVMYVARQLGYAAGLTLSTDGHVIDELDDSPQIPAEDAIGAARNGGACVTGVTGGSTCMTQERLRPAKLPRVQEVRRVGGAGFEPATSCL